jgi:ribosomal protein S18 acetylase RimI-like enzyme
MFTVSQANPELPFSLGGRQSIQPLINEHKAEVLNFLSARPLHTFVMASWIKDNGVESSFNRGTFYGYRDEERQLQGVALIGHVTLFETRVDAALAAFADLTYKCPSAHAVLGEASKISQFESLNMSGDRTPSRICRELLLEKRVPENLNLVQSLRPATSEELEVVAPIHAQTAFEESGVNPLDVDPAGFKERCARRIQQGRVWVAIENGRLKFKADIVSDTPEVVYLEGVYVSAEHRGNGYGARCLTQLTNHLLERTNTVCMLVNEANSAAQKSYGKAGYQFREHYDTLFFDSQRA